MVALLRQGGVMFVNQDDPTKARSTGVGVMAHQGIAMLLARGTLPSADDVSEVARNLAAPFPRVEGRAHRQRLVGAISSYFWHLLPPDEFLFHGSEIDLGTGRPDLLWVNFSGQVLLDEVKTGNAQALHVSRTESQIDSYLETGRNTWGTRFLGVRLLSTNAPRKSLFVHADGQSQSLNSTKFYRRTS